jgi:hypothetical protein
MRITEPRGSLLLRCQPEKRARIDESAVIEARDHTRPRVLRSRCDVDTLGPGNSLQSATRQARQEFFRRHIRQQERSADRLARDPGKRPALRAVLPAGQHSD